MPNTQFLIVKTEKFMSFFEHFAISTCRSSTHLTNYYLDDLNFLLLLLFRVSIALVFFLHKHDKISILFVRLFLSNCTLCCGNSEKSSKFVTIHFFHFVLFNGFLFFSLSICYLFITIALGDFPVVIQIYCILRPEIKLLFCASHF